jgi:glycosyltransferase involved in cell wall biosynthesis
MKPPIRRMGVVVPAHNEEEVVGRCLSSVCAAARAVPLPVRVVVVLDDCVDRTEEICQSFPIDILSVMARSVGVARHAGITSFVSGLADTDAIWIANTDADTVVPRDWLWEQLEFAHAGVDVVAGTVELGDEAPGMGGFRAAYAAGFEGRSAHAHVHGANVGFRASAYLSAGGFPPLALHEDRLLLRRFEASGAVIARSTRLSVRTSGRLIGRCTGGFAATLRRLAATG